MQFLNHLLKVSIETSTQVLNLYLKLSLIPFKNKFQQKQLALYKLYASFQSGNPDQSIILNFLMPVLSRRWLDYTLPGTTDFD